MSTVEYNTYAMLGISYCHCKKALRNNTIGSRNMIKSIYAHNQKRWSEELCT